MARLCFLTERMLQGWGVDHVVHRVAAGLAGLGHEVDVLCVRADRSYGAAPYRLRVLDVPPQDVISKDNVSVKVNAVVYYRVLDPEKAVIQVEQFEQATSQFAQTTLRSVLGQHDLDQMLAERDKLNTEVQRILDERTDAWGIKVSNVELKHIDLNETMIRAIAKQAEAERLRRAKVIDAEGELQAAERLLQAGEILSKRPEAMQLRYLGTLLNIAGEKSSTIVFPLPMNLAQSLGLGEKK